MCELLAKPLYLGKNHEIEKRTHRLRQFDIRETSFMTKYENTNSFIIIFGCGHFSSREVRGKSSSMTTHRIPRNLTAIFYELAIIQCPISKRVCEECFSHVQVPEGNEERRNGYKRKVSSFLPPYVVCEEKPVECHTNHISLTNHRLKSRHI